MTKARVLALFALLALAIALPGCWVHALSPLATEDKVEFERGLLGSWTLPGKEGERLVALTFLRDLGNRYDVVVHMPAEEDAKGKGKKAQPADAREIPLKAFVVRLGEQRFLELSVGGKLLADTELAGPFLLSTYHASRVELDGDTLRLHSPAPDWFEKQAKAGTLDLPHVLVRGGVLLTATTEQLQAWYDKHAGDKEVFAVTLELQRAQAKPADAAPATP